MYQRTIEELQKDEREKVIIDIRREADFLRETYPGAKHIYWEEFEAHRDEVPKDRPVYLICYTGERSDELARELLEEGYEVYSVQGGYRAYLRMKLLESMEDRRLYFRWKRFHADGEAVSGAGAPRQEEFRGGIPRHESGVQ